MNKKELEAIIEGMLFVNGDDGISLATLLEVLNEEKPSDIKKAIDALEEKYEKDEASALSIQRFDKNKYRLQTKTRYNEYLAKLSYVDQPRKLSPSMVEVLSIIAYQQPITKSKVDKLRNADSAYQIQRLKEKKLIKSIGKSENNNANLYVVTESFYKVFNLENGQDDLPAIDLSDLDLSSNQNQLKDKNIFNEERVNEE
ncbi:SMC-Scp complex subunit ScpB [Mesoplasma lactucae]|uniref:SMC-Scp complex subunit ScpB n=1 Tax=Mesoplasma lactucae ATCC 49193 TaxID=81460 RepID=A0A291IRG1_9MOLU|nr:SMC-Scp complex subunit ScpB [Mesoplasma lactucae]ATG97277.1 SMC-Scp complex subunit ScpB [Mesoplasma lactucae ATCC 49193]ATZ20273.1 chromosome condensation and segregation factor B [Mesoplasma lactucae ATCC 49193]MCL8216444.1 Segregation and condensation protein B [Mesoplasma lactucae ATCC 49193]